MAFEKGKSGNPLGRAVEKPFRDALRMEQALLDAGEETPAKPGTLRHIARNLLIRAGADNQAVSIVADRLDGKPAQAIIGGDEDDPAVVLVHRIERVIIDPAKPTDSESV